MKSCRATAGFVATSVILTCLGCFGSKPVDPSRAKVVPAGGVVTYQGKPVEGADVTFINRTAGTTGTGRTDAAGRFVLTTYEPKDGVAPGEQVVTIRRVEIVDNTPKDVDVSAGGKAVPPTVTWLVPQKFSDASRSGLKASVTEQGPNSFPFDLK